MKELEQILYKIVITRKARGYTQAYVAEKLGLGRSSYVRKENGTIPLTLEEFLSIADCLDVSPESFLIPQNQKNKV